MKNRIGDPLRLAHIVKAADQLAGFLAGFSYEQFLNDERTIFAAVRAVEIIGEASRHISDELKDAYPEVAWREATAMRNFVIHQYFDVDVLTLWKTATEQMPVYRADVAHILFSLA